MSETTALNPNKTKVDYTMVDPFIVVNWLMDQVIDLTRQVAELQSMLNLRDRMVCTPVVAAPRRGSFKSNDNEADRFGRMLRDEFNPVSIPWDRYITHKAHRSGVPPINSES